MMSTTADGQMLTIMEQQQRMLSTAEERVRLLTAAIEQREQMIAERVRMITAAIEQRQQMIASIMERRERMFSALHEKYLRQAAAVEKWWSEVDAAQRYVAQVLIQAGLAERHARLITLMSRTDKTPAWKRRSACALFRCTDTDPPAPTVPIVRRQIRHRHIRRFRVCDRR